MSEKIKHRNINNKFQIIYLYAWIVALIQRTQFRFHAFVQLWRCAERTRTQHGYYHIIIICRHRTLLLWHVYPVCVVVTVVVAIADIGRQYIPNPAENAEKQFFEIATFLITLFINLNFIAIIMKLLSYGFFPCVGTTV